jgi:hypothetical protein
MLQKRYSSPEIPMAHNRISRSRAKLEITGAFREQANRLGQMK